MVQVVNTCNLDILGTNHDNNFTWKLKGPKVNLRSYILINKITIE